MKGGEGDEVEERVTEDGKRGGSKRSNDRGSCLFFGDLYEIQWEDRLMARSREGKSTEG